MAANCKALSRLISVYAGVAHCIEKEGKEGGRGAKLTFPSPTSPSEHSTWLLAAFSPVCLSFCLSVHPLSSSFFLPRRNFGLFPFPSSPRGRIHKRVSPEVMQVESGDHPATFWHPLQVCLPWESRETVCIVCDI